MKVKSIYSVRSGDSMGLFDGKSTSLEKLQKALELSIGHEHDLIHLRSNILEKKEALTDLTRVIEKLTEQQKGYISESSNLINVQADLQHKITCLENEITALRKEVIDSKKNAGIASQRADEIGVKISEEKGNRERLTEIVHKDTSKFTKERDQLTTLQNNLVKAYQSDRKKRHDGPSEGLIEFHINESSSFLTIHALGDLHGWAPGLMNYLIKHGLAKIYIGGSDIGKSGEMSSLFPNPMQRINEERALPRVGLDGNPFRSTEIQTSFHRVRIDEVKNDEALVLVGDLVDRGDHNELILEAVRQSILTNMGARWMLIGNHEQMLIESDYDRWSKNEYNYMAEANKEHAGSFLHQPFLTGEDTVEKGLIKNFKIIRGGLGAVLLSQHIALTKTLKPTSLKIYNSMVDPVLKKLQLSPSKIETMMKKSTWEMHRFGIEFLDGLRSISGIDSHPIPGAISLIIGEGHLFMHAEPNGLQGVPGEIWEDLKVLQTNQHLSVAIARMKGGAIVSPSYLWERGWKESSTDIHLYVDKDLRDQIQTVVHGHQAGPGIRIEEAAIHGEITVASIDEGMTPYYFYNYGNFDDAYNPLRVPKGFRVVI